MGEVGHHRRSPYAGLLVNLYYKIMSILRRTPQYQRLLYVDQDDAPRRSRVSFRRRKPRVKVARFAAGAGGQPAPTASGLAGVAAARSRGGVRIRRKNVALPLISVLKRMRDAYVNLMLRLASDGHVTTAMMQCSTPYACSTQPFNMKTLDKTDRELMNRLQAISESRSRDGLNKERVNLFPISVR